MIRNEDFLELRESYIEIGKMVQKYGYGQYNGILRILMGQVNCIDSDENDGKKMKYLTESYSKLFALRGGCFFSQKFQPVSESIFRGADAGVCGQWSTPPAGTEYQ